MSHPTFTLIVLKTGRIEAARAFYAALGIVFEEERHSSGPLHFSSCLGGLVLEVYPLPSGAEPDSNIRLGFAVDDLPAVLGALGQDAPASGGEHAVVKDPDGRSVELRQR